jgi:hypothetical protein
MGNHVITCALARGVRCVLTGKRGEKFEIRCPDSEMCSSSLMTSMMLNGCIPYVQTYRFVFSRVRTSLFDNFTRLPRIIQNAGSHFLRPFASTLCSHLFIFSRVRGSLLVSSEPQETYRRSG